MNPRIRNFILSLLICLGFTGASLANESLPEPAELSATALAKLLPDLRKGGYVIFIRHMTTDHLKEDRRPVDLADCATQRPLKQKGRRQATSIGKAFRHLKIKIDKVYSSPFCRCKDTAQLAFNNFQINDDLYFAMGLSREGKQAKGAALRKLFATTPSPKSNTIIVGHTANLQEAVGLWPKPEGVAYIFKPMSDGKFDVIGKVRPETWSKVK